MDMIVTIFKSLGVDQTVFLQFITLIIVFILVSNLLFSRLKEVLDLRETKTTKLEGDAHQIYKKADELKEQYKAKIEKTHQESNHHAQTKKNQFLKESRDLIKSAEEKLNAEYESKKATILANFKNKREKSLAEVDSLSKNLVDKLTK